MEKNCLGGEETILRHSSPAYTHQHTCEDPPPLRKSGGAGGPDLEQQLIFHDPLHGFDEEVVELQPMPQLLSELLPTGTEWSGGLEQPALVNSVLLQHT